jgi:predicted dehydrogenase/threonine dehydrogenase-like Zn-dependent dehydrogenase
MRQVLLKKGEILVEEVPAPVVEDRYVLVEVAYSVISTGTELAGINRSSSSLISKALSQPDQIKKILRVLREKGVQKTVALIQDKMNSASPIGYSCSGVVIQVGQDVQGLKCGDLVACAGAGIANHAEVVLVPRNLVVRIPEGCALRDAASVAVGAIAMQGVRRAAPSFGETVAVIGLGLLGQLTAQLARIAGCRVIGIDLDENRVHVAETLGMNHGLMSSEVDVCQEVLAKTDGHGVDSTIITASAPADDAVIQLAMEITRKKGKVVVVGDVGLGVDRRPFYERELDLLISTSYGPGRYEEAYEGKGLDYPYAYVRWTEQRNMLEYLKLIAEGRLEFGRLVAAVYPVGEAAEAYRALQSPEKPLAVAIDYGLGTNDSRQKVATQVKCSPARERAGVLRVALVGAGSFAKAVHLPNLRKLSDLYSLRAIVSATGSNAKETARRFGAAYCSTDYDEVLADKDVDMVLICTRHDLHAKMAIQAATAGKAVFLEKPMALNESELSELVKVLQETRVAFTVGFNRRFSPAATRLRNRVASRRSPLMASYQVNAGYKPPDSWVQDAEGGGRIVGEACHMFDFFNFLVGADVECIDVCAISAKTEHVSASDNFVSTLKYSDGSVCTLLYTALGTEKAPKERVAVYCDGEAFLIDDFRELRVHRNPKRGWKGRQDKGHLQELVVFAEVLRRGQLYPIPVEELVRATETSFAIRRECQ